MNKDFVRQNLILMVVAGSQAYGTDTPSSDVDLRGVTLPPAYIREHLFNRFDQDDSPDFLSDYAHLRNPANPKIDGCVYALHKFVKLASGVNPNIIELLFTDPEHQVQVTEIGRALLANSNLFLSQKAAYTFTGYAVSQLKKIERHRKWLISPPQVEPTRWMFNLPDDTAMANLLEGTLKKSIETWNFHEFHLDEETRARLKEAVFELASAASQRTEIDWANWVDSAKESAVDDLARRLQLSGEMLKLLQAEAAFRRAKDQWNNYQTWLKGRNPDRAKLELASGFDTKHAMHLVRLTRMAVEIMRDGKVRVNRRGIDADELSAIRNGAWSYEQVVSYAENQQKLVDSLKDNSPLPRAVDYEKINDLYQDLIS